MSPTREGKETVLPQNYIIREYECERILAELEIGLREMEISERQLISKILSIVIPSLIILTLAIIVADGYSFRGLDIDTSTVNWLAGTVIPEALGLVAIAFRGILGGPGQK